MNTKNIITGLFVYLASMSLAQANTVSLDFQDLINTGSLSVTTAVTDQYSSSGVTFSIAGGTGPVADSFGPDNTSGLYNTFNEGSAIRADFNIDIDSVSFSSIINNPMTVYAYDTANVLLGSLTISGAEIGIISSPDIAYLTFLNTSGTGYAGRNFTILSSLGYNTTITAVPVPAAAFLFASGLLPLAGWGIKRKRT